MKRIILLLLLAAFTSAAGAQRIIKWKMADVVNFYSKANDTVYVVNFWATFCKPCNEEIPYFISTVEKYKGQKVKLLLVSLDLPDYYPAKIAAFAKKKHYNTNMAWLNETNADIFCPMVDKKWSGAIPATIIVNNKTGFRKFIEDEMKPEEFESAIRQAIGGTAFNKYYAPMNNAEVIDRASAGRRNPESKAYMDFVTFRSSDSAVYAVMDGKVEVIARIDSIKVVIIKDKGLFYTYSNLGSTSLKKGDEIKKGQLIGYAAPDLDGDKPSLDLYLTNSIKNIPLTRENFTAWKDKKPFDHSFDPDIAEPK